MSKFMTFLVTLTLIVMGSLTFTLLVGVKLITNNLLKKAGYHPHKSKVAYQQIQTDLNQVTADLTDIRLQLVDIEPHLREMEFLKYAHQDDKAE